MLKLISIYFSNQFKLCELRGPNSRRAFARLFGVAVLAVYLMVMVGFYCKSLIGPLNAVGSPLALVELLSAGASAFVLFSALFTAKGILFGYRDYDLLAALPIPGWKVAGSRMLILYVYELAYSLILLIPAIAVTAWETAPGAEYYISAAVGCLLMPAIPVAVGTVLGTLAGVAAARFRAVGAMRYVLLTIFSLGIMVLSFSFGGMYGDNGGISSAAVSTVAGTAASLRSFWPGVSLFSDALGGNLLSLGALIVICVALFALIAWLNGRYSSKFNAMSSAARTGRRYRLDNRSSGVFGSLLWREFKIYTGSPLYVFNTAFGVLLLILGAAALLIFGGKVLESQAIGSLMNGGGGIVKAAPFVPCLFICMCAISASSISIEGKRFWITRTIPVKTTSIFAAKAALNIIITVPAAMVAAIALAVAFKPQGPEAVMYFVTPLVYCFFSAVFGLWLNLLLPKLDWKTEVAVVKQSAAMFGAIMGGMVVSMAPLFLQATLGASSLPLYVCTAAVALFTIILIVWLRAGGVKRFGKIEG